MLTPYDSNDTPLVIGQQVELLDLWQMVPRPFMGDEHQRVIGQRRRILDIQPGILADVYIQVFGLRARFYVKSTYVRAVQYTGLRRLVHQYRLESAATQQLVNG